MRDKDRAFTESVLMGMREQAWPRVEEVIKERFDGAPAEGILAEMAHYHFDTGGKRIRALIHAMSHREQLESSPEGAWERCGR